MDGLKSVIRVNELNLNSVIIVMQIMVNIVVLWYWQKEHNANLVAIKDLLLQRLQLFQEIKDNQKIIMSDIDQGIHGLIDNKLRVLDKVAEAPVMIKELQAVWEARYNRWEDLLFKTWLEPNIKKDGTDTDKPV